MGRLHPRRTALASSALALALVLVPTAAGAQEAQGRIEVLQIEGPSLAGNPLGIDSTRRVSVYVPPGYDAEPDRAYPTLYVLHGIYDSDRTWTVSWSSAPPGWGTLQGLMDRGIASGALAPMIVVIPDSEKTCHYTDSVLKGDWERFLARDLVDFIDREYRTLAQAASRGITGHSMGGHGALKLAMRYPDVFGATYGLSPSLLGFGGDLGGQHPAFAALPEIDDEAELAAADPWVQAMVGIGRCLAPAPGREPLLIDPPFVVRDGVPAPEEPGHGRWREQMPLYMVDGHADALRGLRGLRFDAGVDDEFTHIPITAQALSEALTARGIAHEFELYEGDHRNRLWGPEGRLYRELLPWFSERLVSAVRRP